MQNLVYAYILDIQCFRYYTGKTDIYTFFGFSNNDHKIYLYESKLNGLQQGYTQNQSASTQQQIQNTNNFFNSNTNISLEEPLFCPNSNLYYLYFKENSYPFKYSIFSNINFMDIKNIVDLQRGFRISQNDPNYYTYIGFNKSIDRINAVKNLQKQTAHLDVNYIKLLDDDYEYEDE